jgi:hypothetical protein
VVGNCFADHSRAIIDHRCTACLHSSRPSENHSMSHVPVVVSRLRTFAGHRIGLLPRPLSLFSLAPTYFILSFNSAFATPHTSPTSRISHVLVSRVLVFIHWPTFLKLCSRKTLPYQLLVSLTRQWSSLILSCFLVSRTVARPRIDRMFRLSGLPCKLNLISCKRCICDNQCCTK